MLPLVPAYLAHLTGTATGFDGGSGRRATVTHAVTFVLGFTIVFTVVGASVGLIAAARQRALELCGARPDRDRDGRPDQIVIGVLMFTDDLTIFNRYVDF